MPDGPFGGIVVLGPVIVSLEAAVLLKTRLGRVQLEHDS